MAPESPGWVRPAALWVLAITALRVALLGFNRTDLFVDEAQYWLWGQEPALGYYSKPPLIGWVLALFTLPGDDPFWIRLPGPLFHGVTAMILGAAAQRMFGPRAALLTALAYVTLPAVALGSLLISTDTVMFPFLAGAFALYLRLLDRQEAWAAATAGLLLGLAFLAKYAALYLVGGAALAAVLVPGARPRLAHAALLLGVFAATAAPNLAWNALNGFSTLSHTVDNAGWLRAPALTLNPGGLAAFFLSQFAVIGPVLFGVWLWLALRWRRQPPAVSFLLTLSVPVLGVVCLQALLAGAYANWAMAAYVAGVPAGAAWLARGHRGWRVASFAINGLFCLALPLATLAPERLEIGGRQVMERYLGRTEMSEMIMDIAGDLNLARIVAGHRDVLADLVYSGRGRGFHIFTIPPAGRPPHHYAMTRPFPGGDGEVLLILPTRDAPPCPEDAAELVEIAPEQGAYRTMPQTLYLVPGSCLAPPPGAG